MPVQKDRSCLHWASKGGHLDVVKYLHECGGKKLLMQTDDVSWDVASDMCVCVVCNIHVLDINIVVTVVWACSGWTAMLLLCV